MSMDTSYDDFDEFTAPSDPQVATAEFEIDRALEQLQHFRSQLDVAESIETRRVTEAKEWAQGERDRLAPQIERAEEFIEQAHLAILTRDPKAKTLRSPSGTSKVTKVSKPSIDITDPDALIAWAYDSGAGEEWEAALAKIDELRAVGDPKTPGLVIEPEPKPKPSKTALAKLEALVKWNEDGTGVLVHPDTAEVIPGVEFDRSKTHRHKVETTTVSDS